MRSFLDPPLLTPEAAAVAASALGTRLPVWIAGGPGRGAYDVARALHLGGSPSGFCSIRRPIGSSELEHRLVACAGEIEPGEPISLYVESVDRQPEETQERLLQLIEEGFLHEGGRLSVRVMAQSNAGSLPDPPRMLRALRLKLEALRLPLPSLEERGTELPEIARAFAGILARRLGMQIPEWTRDQWLRIADGAPGIDDLEPRILSRLLEPAGKADAAASAVPEPLQTPLPKPAPGLPLGRPGIPLDVILTELAHELKNPMVTIKTFAQHLDRLIGDEELRERFSRLTTEAVNRMDGFLDELLQYAHFGRPAKLPAGLRDLIERALSESDAELRERVEWNGAKPDGPISVDPEQFAFALRLLFRGFSRELPAQAPLVLTSAPSGDFVIRTRAGGGIRRLQSHVRDGAGDQPETSLHFAMATDLVRRNGGDLRVARDQESLEARFVLPAAES